MQLGAVGSEYLPRAEVGGLFQYHAVAFIDQHARSQRERLLAAADNQHVVRRHVEAAAAPEIVGHLHAQGLVALRTGDVERGVRGCACQLACPDIVEQRVDLWIAELQVVAQAAVLHGDRAVQHQTCAPREARRRRYLGSARCRSDRGLGLQVRDVAARTDPALDKALGAQLLIGGQYRNARKLQLARQYPRGWQARAGPEAAIENRAFHGAGELCVLRALTVEF